MVDQKLPKTRKGASLRLSVPWAGYRGNNANFAEADGALIGRDLNNFVTRRTEVHALFIRERERTRRFSMAIAGVLLALACAIPVFAPPGRESLSFWIGAALFVFAAGAMGYTSIKMATDKKELTLTTDEQPEADRT